MFVFKLLLFYVQDYMEIQNKNKDGKSALWSEEIDDVEP